MAHVFDAGPKPVERATNASSPAWSRRRTLPGAAESQTSAPPPTAGSTAPFPASRDGPLDRPYNAILFNEEAYHLRPAEGFATKACAVQQLRGTTFLNHYIGSSMCMPSRGVMMFSGQPPQISGAFDRMQTGYVPTDRTDRPSIGTVFRELSYRTACYGKFEPRRDIITPKPTVNYSDALSVYGFQSFEPDGNKTGAPVQDYRTDIYTGSVAVRWLCTEGHALNRQGILWFLVVNVISPHDITYADVNQPGQIVQTSSTGGLITPPPDNTAFSTRWKFEPSPSAREPLDKPGRLRAQIADIIGGSAWLDESPRDATAMWNDYYNFYSEPGAQQRSHVAGCTRYDLGARPLAPDLGDAHGRSRRAWWTAWRAAAAF